MSGEYAAFYMRKCIFQERAEKCIGKQWVILKKAKDAS